jgi:hypothetical protein
MQLDGLGVHHTQWQNMQLDGLGVHHTQNTRTMQEELTSQVCVSIDAGGCTAKAAFVLDQPVLCGAVQPQGRLQEQVKEGTLGVYLGALKCSKTALHATGENDGEQPDAGSIPVRPLPLHRQAREYNTNDRQARVHQTN